MLLEMMWHVLIWRSIIYKYVWEIIIFSKAGFTFLTFKDLFMDHFLSKHFLQQSSLSAPSFAPTCSNCLSS